MQYGWLALGVVAAMGCCDRRHVDDVERGTTPRRMLTAQNVGSQPGCTLIELQRDYGAPRPFVGPISGRVYQFGGRRVVGAVLDVDLRSSDPRRPGMLELLDMAGLLFRRLA